MTTKKRKRENNQSLESVGLIHILSNYISVDDISSLIADYYCTPLMFVKFTSRSCRGGESYYMWLQWSGNEDILRELEYCINCGTEKISESSSYIPPDGLIDCADMIDMDAELELDTLVRLTEQEVDTLVKYANQSDSHIYQKIKGCMTVPNIPNKPAHDWAFAWSSVYIDRIENLFQ